ncbi:uncharacterized protein LOC124911716 [Impatiens glandulifera]|uniref:uncharacterized protein LOC124911716 n=1 Tax=Impatiens glandulifera TaxID=253017 RepID=UPI001FB10FB8|nr:uncharacterized protein LOC124911716 [Impatiens glandulifera]
MLLGRLLIIRPNSKHALGFLNGEEESHLASWPCKHLQHRTGFHGVSMGSAQSSWNSRKNGTFSMNEQSGSEPGKWVLSRSVLSNRVSLFLKTPSGFGKFFNRAYASLMANQDDSEERKQDELLDVVIKQVSAGSDQLIMSDGNNSNGNGGGNKRKNGDNNGDDGGENMLALVWLWYWRWWQHRESNKPDKDNNIDNINMNPLRFFEKIYTDDINMNPLRFFEKIYTDVIFIPISRLVFEVFPLDAFTTLLTEVHVSRGMPRLSAYLKALWTTLWLVCLLMAVLIMFALGVLAIGPIALALMALESYLWPPPPPNHSDDRDDDNEDVS